MSKKGQEETALLPIAKIFSESWRLVSGIKLPIILLYFIPLIPIIISFLVFTMIIGPMRYTVSLFTFLIITSVFVFVAFIFMFSILWFILAMSTMIGVRQAIGLTTTISIAYKQCMGAKKELFLLFIVWIILSGLYSLISMFILPNGDLGFLLNFALYLIYVYLSMPLIIFAVPLTIIKRSSMASAISSSWDKMKKYWMEIIVLYLIQMILIFISAMPLGIGLIWTIPMFYAITGILFREVYQLKKKPVKNNVDV